MLHMRKLLLVLAAVWLLAGQARAMDETVSLPPEIWRAAPDAAELISDDPEDGFGLFSGLGEVLSETLADMKSIITSGLRSAAAIMAGAVLLGAAESAAPAGKETLTRCSTAIGALWITAVSAGDLNALIGLGRETVTELNVLGKALLPVLAAAEAAGGGITAASVRQVAAVFFANLLLSVIEKFLIPAVYLYIGTAAANAVVEGGALERIGALLKKTISWTLSGLVFLFVTYLTISGAIAGAADARAVALAKSAVSAAVPVVGGILSEAAESVLAGAGLVHGMAGAAGTLALLGVCLAPFLHLGCQYLFYQAASLVSAAAGPAKLTKLISMLGDAFALVLAMVGSAAVVLLAALLSSMAAVSPG